MGHNAAGQNIWKGSLHNPFGWRPTLFASVWLKIACRKISKGTSGKTGSYIIKPEVFWSLQRPTEKVDGRKIQKPELEACLVSHVHSPLLERLQIGAKHFHRWKGEANLHPTAHGLATHLLDYDPHIGKPWLIGNCRQIYHCQLDLFIVFLFCNAT